MARAQHRKFRSYSGPRILGDKIDLKPDHSRASHHADRAYWLTTQVESGGRVGSIVMYDGTAVTAGLDQHIAVYPKELANEDYNAKDDQGSLWKLLRRMELASATVQVRGLGYESDLQRLWNALAGEGWYVSQDGCLRYHTDSTVMIAGKNQSVRAGDLVYGRHIRDIFTPDNGKVPKKGRSSMEHQAMWATAERWAELFWAVFSDPDLIPAQVDFGIEHLVKRTKKRRIKIRLTRQGEGKWTKRVSLEWLAYGGRDVSSRIVGEGDWIEELDLAMSVYQSHSVNAPAIANKVIARAWEGSITGAARRDAARAFAKKLIKLLGNSTYGRWDDDIKHGRYQRTRSAARASGLWSRSLFDGAKAIMPKDLRG